MSAGDMIPHCCICHRRHYGADCPDLPHRTVPMTNPLSDVVERLRHIVRREQRLISSVVALPREDCATLTEAIATIERLSAERLQLRELLEKAAPFVGWASAREQAVAGVWADELCVEIDAALSNTAEGDNEQ